MIDSMLFQRGHIMIRIGNQTDDYDVVVPEHYFYKVLGIKGEIIDSNGSEYELVSLDKDDNFEIKFNVYENEFETDDGRIVGFGELIVRCKGQAIQEDDYDILRIDTFDIINRIYGKYDELS
jgi:hypothetical protein